MAQRALRRLPSTKASPRAKSLAPRLKPSTLRALDQAAEAASAFDTALADRRGLGRLDESYGDLCACAAALITALLEDPGAIRVFSSETALALSAYARRERAPAQRPEDDVALVARLLTDLR